MDRTAAVFGDACVLAGDLTFRTAGAVKDRLQEAVGTMSTVRIDCSRAEDVDFAFIQLLLAARRSANAMGKEFIVVSPEDGPVALAVVSAGVALEGGEDEQGHPLRR